MSKLLRIMKIITLIKMCTLSNEYLISKRASRLYNCQIIENRNSPLWFQSGVICICKNDPIVSQQNQVNLSATLDRDSMISRSWVTKTNLKSRWHNFQQYLDMVTLQRHQLLNEASVSMNTQDAPFRCSDKNVILCEKWTIRPKNATQTLAYNDRDPSK